MNKLSEISNVARKIILLLPILVILFSISLPLIVSAGEYQIEGGGTVKYEGLVPCGKKAPTGDESQEVTMPCQFCHFFVMFKGIIDWIIGVIVPLIAVLMLVVTGFMFFTSVGNPSTMGKAKTMITSIVIGLVLIYGAWMIVNTILTFPGFVNFQFQGFDFTKWFQIDCPITLPTTGQ